MKRLNFSTSIYSLFEELHKPIVGISTQKIACDVTIGLIAWHQDGTGICCRSKMHEVAPRSELGVLDFSKLSGNRDNKIEGFLINDFTPLETSEVFLMTIEVGDVIAESGIVFYSSSGRLVIACGAAPYSLVICDSRFPNLDFVAEYGVAEYKKEPMQRKIT